MATITNTATPVHKGSGITRDTTLAGPSHGGRKRCGPSAQKALHRLDRFAFLVEDKVTGTFESLEFRLGDALTPEFGILDRQELIVFAPYKSVGMVSRCI